MLEGQRGSIAFELRVVPRFDYGQVRPWIRRHGHHLHSATGGSTRMRVGTPGNTTTNLSLPRCFSLGREVLLFATCNSLDAAGGSEQNHRSDARSPDDCVGLIGAVR